MNLSHSVVSGSLESLTAAKVRFSDHLDIGPTWAGLLAVVRGRLPPLNVIHFP